MDSIKVATCSVENIDNIDYKVLELENGSEVVERKFSIKEEIQEENYSTTVTNMVVTQEHKQSIKVTENGNPVDKKPL